MATRSIFTTADDVTPGAVPDSDTDVVAFDVWIVTITLTNVGAATATITITDKQSTPIPLLKDLPVDPGAPLVVSWPSNDPAYMPGGVKWQASAAATIVARMRYKY